MAVRVEELPEIHTIILTVTAPIRFPDDVTVPLSATCAFKEKIGTPVARLMDFSGSNLQFGDMIMGLGGERDQPGGFWDADVYNIIVGTNEWVKFGISAMQQQSQYEGANAKALVGSREEALDIAKSLIGK